MKNIRRKCFMLIAAIVTSLCILVVPTIGSAQEKTSKDWVKLYEPHVHNEMPYRIMKPKHFDASKRYPVIVSLHGGGGRGTDNRKQLRGWNMLLAEEQRRTDYPCYVLAPQANRLWNAAHLRNIKDVVAALPSVDMDRIYILGHSMGGHGTYILIQIDPGYFAAAAPSAGSGLRRTEEFIDASLIKDVPIWAFHGDKDRVCPIERDQKLFAEMEKLEGIMKLTTWAGDRHGVAEKMITGSDNGSTQLSSDCCDPEPVFLKWLFSQKRSNNQQNDDPKSQHMLDRYDKDGDGKLSLDEFPEDIRKKFHKIDADSDDWDMGPFVKRKQPILRPTSDSRWQCPIRGKEVRWEEQNVYNPAVVVRNGKVYLLYRADDKSPDLKWGRTCRIGLAYSEDGINFTRHTKPVLYPENDPWKKYEWVGGCEDLHIIEGEDGTYYMNYTTWNGKRDTMSVATSRDLYHWTKHGPAFRKAAPEKVYGSRSGVVVSRLQGNRLIATKINGKYWMYYTHPCALAWSDNLINWTPAGKSVWSGRHEAGAIALLREDGILLMFNGPDWPKTSPSRGPWTLGQALIDRNDLTTVLKHQDQPFLYPERDWEKKGFVGRTTVANGLVYFKGEWLLYYGAADRVIGLATCKKKD